MNITCISHMYYMYIACILHVYVLRNSDILHFFSFIVHVILDSYDIYILHFYCACITVHAYYISITRISILHLCYIYSIE